jgi:hypothetical protein
MTRAPYSPWSAANADKLRRTPQPCSPQSFCPLPSPDHDLEVHSRNLPLGKHHSENGTTCYNNFKPFAWKRHLENAIENAIRTNYLKWVLLAVRGFTCTWYSVMFPSEGGALALTATFRGTSCLNSARRKSCAQEAPIKRPGAVQMCLNILWTVYLAESSSPTSARNSAPNSAGFSRSNKYGGGGCENMLGCC